MNAPKGITKELAEKIADAHEDIQNIYALLDCTEGETRSYVHVVSTFVDENGDECCQRRAAVRYGDADEIIYCLRDRATARLAALQAEAAEALGVEVSPPVAAPTFKVGDRVRRKDVIGGGHEMIVRGIDRDRVEVEWLSGGMKSVTYILATGLELIPSPLSGDFTSEEDDAWLVRVGKVIARAQGQDPVSGPKRREYRIGTMSEDDTLKAGWEDRGSGGWINAYSAKPRLTPEARLILRTAEQTLTAEERAKVEAGE